MAFDYLRFPLLAQLGKEAFRKYPFTQYSNELRIDDEVAALFGYVSIIKDLTNSVVESLDELGTYMTGFDKEFKEFRKWIENEGLKERVALVLNVWLADGTLADIINTDVFNMKANTVDLNKTNVQVSKNTIVLSKIEPLTADVWYENLGEGPFENVGIESRLNNG